MNWGYRFRPSHIAGKTLVGDLFDHVRPFPGGGELVHPFGFLLSTENEVAESKRMIFDVWLCGRRWSGFLPQPYRHPLSEQLRLVLHHNFPP